jgi:hypothetical protein
MSFRLFGFDFSRLILPPPLKSGWRQFRVAHRVLDILVPEIGLQASGVSSRVCLVKPASVPQHMRVRFDREPGCLASPANELLKVGHRHRRAALGHEQEWRSAFGLAVQAAQRPQLTPGQRVSCWRAVLHPGDCEVCGREVHLRPLQVDKLAGSQAMPEGEQDHRLVAVRPAIAFAPLDQLLDLAFGEVFAGSDLGVFGPTWGDFPYFNGWRYNF